MKRFEWTSLYVGRLAINEVYGLVKSTILEANEVRAQIGAIPDAALNTMEAVNNAMYEQMNREMKSLLTEQLIEIDKDRDDRFAEIRRNINTAVKGRNPEKKNAGEKLKHFMTPYWNLPKIALDPQTRIFTEMYEKYLENGELQTQAEIIGIAEMLTELKEVNTQFDGIYKERREQEVAQAGPSASSLKGDVVKSYEDFCTAIEQAVNFMPNNDLVSLSKKMDNLRAKYAKLITKSEKSEETPAEVQEDDVDVNE